MISALKGSNEIRDEVDANAADGGDVLRLHSPDRGLGALLKPRRRF